MLEAMNWVSEDKMTTSLPSSLKKATEKAIDIFVQILMSGWNFDVFVEIC